MQEQIESHTQPKMYLDDGDDNVAFFSITGAAEGLGAQGDSADGYFWQTETDVPEGWMPKDCAYGIATLMLDLTERKKWSSDDFLRMVVDEFRSIAEI
jgi:hypothetical protein